MKYLLFLSLLSLCYANPYIGKKMYVNPTFQKDIQSSIATTTDPVTLKNLQTASNQPTAFWLDVMSKVQENGVGLNSANGILQDASKQSPIPVVTFIVYDLPSRDCNAGASNGEIPCADAQCTAGINTYQNSYIMPLVNVLKKYPNVPVVLIIEPDSLPNLVTNLGNPKCTRAQEVYKSCIIFAVNQFSTLSNVVMYLDAAHGGWLGWDNNAQGFATLVNSMNIVSKLRGFATNVANYQALGRMCQSVGWCLPPGNPSDPCCADPCSLTNQYNGAQNEMNYMQLLSSKFPNKFFVTDTSRNGVPNIRTNCGNWCNIKGGLGQLPTTNTGSSIVDALLWIKTPGESDGCAPAGGSCGRYDYMCSSVDSFQPAPEAGRWFDSIIKILAKNANFGSINPQPSPQPSPSQPIWRCKQCVSF
jgi:cellulose 1,4-beta-cellobiosidase